MPLPRQPAAAGRFYPAGKDECLQMLESLTKPANIDGHVVGAVVPHAGWIYSGAAAALGITALKPESPETVVIFGAVHTRDLNAASVYATGGWKTPLGVVPVDWELAERVLQHDLMTDNTEAHANEHSIEVQLPFIQYILGNVKILPISVRPSQNSAEIGKIIARKIKELGRKAVFLSSTDLTHYGPHFRFEPHGPGEAGVRWAKDVNDRRFVSLIENLEADKVVKEAAENRNACGAGAVAAGIAAAVELGAKRYIELRHTTSADGESDATTSVGYEAGVFV